MHRIAKRGDIRIELKNQAGAVLWRVGYDAEYGQPGPLAYKLDTLIINRKIEEAGRPLPKLIKLGSLSEICRYLGLADSGTNRTSVRSALFQNATASINAKITYRRSDKSERFLEALFTRYSVILTGDTLPDGGKADAVYLVLNDIYQEVLSEAQTRPLDYEYMKALPPAAQRFYEIASYQVYAALLHKNPRAKLTYSDYCTLSTQTRYPDWDHVKKQMYKVHLPHLRFGYLAKVEYEATTDAEGRPDWNMLYTPGPNAAAEFRAFKGGGNRAVQKLTPKPSRAEALPLPFPPTATATTIATTTPRAAAAKKAEPQPEPLSPETAALVEELVASELNRGAALLYAKGNPQECRRQLEYLPYVAEFKSSKGAYLRSAIEEGYGPPKGYTTAKKQEEAARKKREESEQRKAQEAAQKAAQAANAAQVDDSIGRLEIEDPEAFSAFCGYVEEERGKVEVKYKNLSASIRARMIKTFDTPQKRRELFAAWKEARPKRDA